MYYFRGEGQLFLLSAVSVALFPFDGHLSFGLPFQVLQVESIAVFLAD